MFQVAPKFMRPKIEAAIEKTKDLAVAGVRGIGGFTAGFEKATGLSHIRYQGICCFYWPWPSAFLF